MPTDLTPGIETGVRKDKGRERFEGRSETGIEVWTETRYSDKTAHREFGQGRGLVVTGSKRERRLIWVGE